MVQHNGKKSFCEWYKAVPEENKQRTVGAFNWGMLQAEGGFLGSGLPGCCVLLRWAIAQNQRKGCSTLSLPMTGGILTGSVLAVTSHKSASDLTAGIMPSHLFTNFSPLFPLSLGSMFHLVSWGLGIHKMSNVLYQVCNKKIEKFWMWADKPFTAKNTGVCLLNYGRAEIWRCLAFVHWFSGESYRLVLCCKQKSKFCIYCTDCIYSAYIQYIFMK